MGNSLFLPATENLESLLGRDLAAVCAMARGQAPHRATARAARIKDEDGHRRE